MKDFNIIIIASSPNPEWNKLADYLHWEIALQWLQCNCYNAIATMLITTVITMANLFGKCCTTVVGCYATITKIWSAVKEWWWIYITHAIGQQHHQQLYHQHNNHSKCFYSGIIFSPCFIWYSIVLSLFLFYSIFSSWESRGLCLSLGHFEQGFRKRQAVLKLEERSHCTKTRVHSFPTIFFLLL